MITRAAFAILAVVLTAACSGSSSAPDTAQGSSALHANDAVATDLTGTWVFDLDASEVASNIKAECADKTPNDAAKQTACWNAIHEEAAREKIRFSKADGSGHSVWTSFGLDEKQKEIVFLEMPVELGADGQGHVLAKIAGKATGVQAEHFSKSSVNQMRIEVVSANTIAMNDPKKGRLVFNKE